MSEIIRGTTPTISFSFSSVSVTDITAAYMTVNSMGKKLLERDMETVTVGTRTLEWTLTQEETLRLNVGTMVQIMCDWKLNDGTRGRSNIAEYVVGETGKNEVI